MKIHLVEYKIKHSLEELEMKGYRMKASTFFHVRNIKNSVK